MSPASTSAHLNPLELDDKDDCTLQFLGALKLSAFVHLLPINLAQSSRPPQFFSTPLPARVSSSLLLLTLPLSEGMVSRLDPVPLCRFEQGRSYTFPFPNLTLGKYM